MMAGDWNKWWLATETNVGWRLKQMLASDWHECWLATETNVGWRLIRMLAGDWNECWLATDTNVGWRLNECWLATERMLAGSRQPTFVETWKVWNTSCMSALLSATIGESWSSANRILKLVIWRLFVTRVELGFRQKKYYVPHPSILLHMKDKHTRMM